MNSNKKNRINSETFLLDILAGLPVSFAVLALGAAFGVMSGRGAFAGMIAAGIIPIITGLFGGTRISISSPTAPMTAVSALVIAFAYENFAGDKILAEQFLTLVFLLLGGLLIVAGLFRVGTLIRYVPQVVILGFMSGIALLIWVSQAKTLFGLGGKTAIEGGITTNAVIAFSTFLLILLLPLLLKKLNVTKSILLFIPFTLVSILLMTVITAVLGVDVGKVELGITTNSFSEFFNLVKAYLPSKKILTEEYILMALPYALQLTLLAYLDSLLTALVMDHLTKEKSKLNKELFGQGLSNIFAAVCMGIPGAQTTVSSVLLYKEGAKTRLGSVITGVFVLLGFLIFKDYVTLIASAVFAGVLIKIAFDVFEKEFLKSYLKNKWYYLRSRNIQLGFTIYTMLVTTFVDLNVAVISGTIFFYIGKKMFGFTDAN